MMKETFLKRTLTKEDNENFERSTKTHKIVQSSGFLGRLLGLLLKTYLR